MDRQIFILALIAICMVGWVVTTAIRAKHGYPLTDDWGNTVDRGLPDAAQKFELLGSENDRLKGQVLRLEERIAVLERIATDEGARLGREIESLR
ncbi:hypothetical protein [Sphingomonas montana]|uniref:hypothetical protein n=1 Tax=Sphingomonas montana TaxID=1843236 RepID=UPI00096E0979|nr:hypothetical protein [Sphingomonas montana]